MQILRDTAALAIIILLVLTVRIEADGAPIDIDLATPVEAAALETPQLGTPEFDDASDVETELQFLSLGAFAAASADLALRAEADSRPSGCTAKQSRRTIVIRHQLEGVPQLVRDVQHIVLDGTWELKTIPGGMTAPEAPEATTSCPCEASLNPGLSC
jgi:hypothetical protein